MRDPKRINSTLDAIKSVWYLHPNMQFGQLLVAATGRDDPFYVEDDRLVEMLNNDFPAVETSEAPHAKIEEVINVIREVWTKVPDWRLCQLAVNFSYNHGLKYISDDIFIHHLRKAGNN